MSTWSPDFNPRIDARRPDLVRLIVEVEALRRSVLKIPIPPGRREKFDHMNIVRQIKGTTGIEGNTLGEDRIDKLVSQSAGARAGDAGGVTPTSGSAPAAGIRLEEREVLNADRVLHFIREDIAREPAGRISEKLIRSLHKLTTEGCDYKDNIPGQYRGHDVVAGDYRPPGHEAVPDLMRRFVSFINSREVTEAYGTLVRAILGHFYLLSIHPFGDGNGRTARALEAYTLYGGGYNVRGFYSLANFLYRNRVEYVNALQAARFEHGGNLTEFTLFALRGLVEELAAIQDDILAYVKTLIFRDVCLEAWKERRISGRALALLEYLSLIAPAGISLDHFRSRRDRLVMGLYEGLSDKTLTRDFRLLLRSQLVTAKDGVLAANLGLLE